MLEVTKFVDQTLYYFEASAFISGTYFPRYFIQGPGFQHKKFLFLSKFIKY